MQRSEKEIDPKIDLVDTGSKILMKVATMLLLQTQKVTTTPQQRHIDPLLDKLQKQLEPKLEPNLEYHISIKHYRYKLKTEIAQ